MPNAISREELRAAIDEARVTVVDALPPAPFGQRHLPGALNVVAEDPTNRCVPCCPTRPTVLDRPADAGGGLSVAVLGAVALALPGDLSRSGRYAVLVGDQVPPGAAALSGAADLTVVLQLT